MENLELVMLGTAICAEFPLLPLRTLARWLPIDILRRLFLNMAYLQDYTQRAVKQANDPENDRPSVFRYINSNMEKGQGMLTDDCIRDEAMVVMIAGSESSATILTYIIWCSLNDPEVQRKLEEEVKGLDDEYTDSDLEALPYLNAVIEETLRLYGTTSFLPRDAPANGARMSGFFIPGGTTVTTQSYSIQRDRKLWDRPDE